MKKSGVLVFILAAGALYGCVEQPNEPSVTSTAGISFEEYRATAVREPGTGAYIVDWDIVLNSDEELYNYWQGYQQGALTIYAINGVDQKWSATQKKNLTY